LHKEELYDLYCSTNIAKVIKSMRMSCAGNVTHTGENRRAYRFWVGKPQGKSHLEDLGMDQMSVLKWMLKK
jgi:hypothetical protein